MRRSIVAATCLTATFSLATTALATQFLPLGPKSSALGSNLEVVTSPPDCETATSVALGDQICDDNANGAHAVDAWGCTPAWVESGGELVYHLVIETPTQIEVRLDAACDLDVFVLSGCGEAVECLASGDTGVKSLDPVTEDVYVVIDGFAGAECSFCVDFLIPGGVGTEAVSFGHAKSRYGEGSQ